MEKENPLNALLEFQKSFAVQSQKLGESANSAATAFDLFSDAVILSASAVGDVLESEIISD